jgi:4-phytase / acid phosphatase
MPNDSSHLLLRVCLALMLLPAISPILAQGAEINPAKLKLVIIISRHGVRSPTGTPEQLNPYSAQPWPGWDVPPGYLTPRGARLMTLFGAYYRSYYAQRGLFETGGCADAAHVSFYSDLDQRTVETGKALAAGMFPGCSLREQSERRALTDGQADPIFHPLTAGVGNLDHDRALASVAGRIGSNPAAVTEAYRPQLERLQRILLGCPATGLCPQPGHIAAKLLLDTPASLEDGKGDRLAALKGPLSTASTITENFLLEFTTGMPMDQVAWGRVDLATLKELLALHTAAADLGRRSSYLATAQASNALAHIRDTLQQAVTGKEVSGALGRLGDSAVILVGHDTNLANIAGALNLNWLVDGRRDDTPPGGALVFELWGVPAGSHFEVKAYYTAQTLEQMRNQTVLRLENPPARANVFIPGCSSGADDFPCDWNAFQKTLTTAIDSTFVN